MGTFNYAMCQQYKAISKNNQNEKHLFKIFFFRNAQIMPCSDV